MARLLGSGAAFVFFSFAYPAALLLQQNSHLYQRTQTVLTFALIVSVGICVAGVASIATASLSSRIRRAILVALGIPVLLAMMYAPISDFVRDRTILVAVYVLLTGAAPIIGYFLDLKPPNAILAGLIVFNMVLVVAHGARENVPAQSGAIVSRSIVFQHKPNVYLVILESYNSMDVRRTTYGIDNGPLSAALAELGYTVYERTYANYWSTIFSLSSVFSMSHHYYENSVDIADGGRHRKVIGGVIDNPVLQTFSDNGYTLDYSHFSPSMYHPGPLLDRVAPQPVLQPLELFSGMYIVPRRLAGWDVWQSPAFQRFLSLPNRFLMPPAVRSAEGNRRPTFTLLYAGADHTRDRVIADQAWIDSYRGLVAQSDRALIGLVREISRKDPDALIVLLGDHGAWLYRDRWMGVQSDPNRNMRENGVTPVEVTKDLFEVFLAVKWPKGSVPPGPFSPVNLFRAVFAVLAPGSRVERTNAEDDSFAWVFLRDSLTATPRLYRTVRNGVPVDAWEPIDISRR